MRPQCFQNYNINKIIHFVWINASAFADMRDTMTVYLSFFLLKQKKYDKFHHTNKYEGILHNNMALLHRIYNNYSKNNNKLKL